MKEKLWTKNFISISVSNLFLFLSFYLLLTTLPIYALQDLHTKESSVGLIVSVFLFAAIIIRPIAGQQMERFGKRFLFLVSLSIFLVSSILYFLTDSLTSILLLRFFHGLGFGIATTAAGTIVAETLPDSRRGEGMGYFAMSMNLAMAFGPFLGLTALNEFGIHSVFMMAFCFSIISFIAGLLIHLPATKVIKSKEVKFNFKLNALIERSAVKVSLFAALFGIIYSSIISFVSVYAKSIGLTSVGSYFFIVYAIVLLISRPFTGKWFDLYGAKYIVYASIILFGAGMVLLSLSSSPVIFLISAAFIGVGYGTLFSSLQTIVIQDAPSEKRGLATATYFSIYDLGMSIGSFVVGIILSKVGFHALYGGSVFLIVLGIGIFYLITKQQGTNEVTEIKKIS
ncbi:MFS transporter [Bacillus sp. RG28]|uniref:MFS transporter n=1 Tax=Gottfriedia endophytica TaxID=2820819 RepID=A0A940NKR9_9BACI|nr:MFS transporter [Gottfriedia endophytica]MBP0723989.1 MFS transporter [Gottfriedia endophytica]